MTKQKWKKIGWILAEVLIVLLCVSAVYVMNYYHADDTALACMTNGVEGVTVTTEADGSIVFLPDKPQAGLIFYPGGKVQAEAYAPLLCRLAQQGICCVLTPMPLRLAFLNVNAADGIPARFPQITDWYIGGHSLGGVAAAMYLQKHADGYKGLVLLAAYSSVDLSGTNLAVLSVYGENDGVLNFTSYEKDKFNLPADFTEVCIPGGCHGWFGNYGMQKGDGTPTITADEQQQITADTVADWMEIQPAAAEAPQPAA